MKVRKSAPKLEFGVYLKIFRVVTYFEGIDNIEEYDRLNGSNSKTLSEMVASQS